MDSIKRKSFNANVDLIHGPIFKSLIIFALPLFISNIFQQLYNTVDTMIVGNFLGDASLAAIGSCTSIYDLLVGFALGIGNGLAIVTARSFGSKDEKLLKKSVASSLVIGIVVSIGLTLIGLIFLQPLLHLLNTPANIIDEAYSYIFFIVLFIIVMFAYNLCAGLMRAIGNSVMPLVFLVISSVLNIILDLVFITQLNMGVQGAAVATVISQGTSVILCIIYMFKKTPLLLPKKEHFEVDKDLYKELLGQGFSMGFMNCIVSAGSVILQYGINNLGYLIIAGHTAARKLYMFFNMPFTAMCLVGLVAVVVIAKLLGATPEIICSLAPKSVTTPIAMEVSKATGGIPSLTAAVVVVVGLFGAVFGFKVLRVGHVGSPIAQGLSMGTATHAVGTSTAMEISGKYGAYASLGLTLNGIMTAIFTPTILRLLGVI